MLSIAQKYIPQNSTWKCNPCSPIYACFWLSRKYYVFIKIQQIGKNFDFYHYLCEYMVLLLANENVVIIKNFSFEMKIFNVWVSISNQHGFVLDEKSNVQKKTGRTINADRIFSVVFRRVFFPSGTPLYEFISQIYLLFPWRKLPRLFK